MRSRSITIRDVAREAGVSVSTAARVLAGNEHVAPERRETVLAAAARLNYHTNALARELARGRSGAIGVLVQDLSNPFYSLVVKGVEAGLHGSEHFAFFLSGGDTVEVQQALGRMLARRVDAIIVLGGRSAEEDLRQVAESTPLILVSRNIPGLEHRTIQIENRRGAHEATRHLLDLGHRRIVHLAGLTGHPHAVERRSGYEEALTEGGLAVDEGLIVEGDFEEAPGAAAVSALLERGIDFTALFAANDQMAMAAIGELTRRGRRVPEDVSVVGFDDLPFAAFLSPSLTTVRQPALQVGFAAAQATVLLVKGTEPSLRSFDTDLVVRRSSARLGGA
jgi:LacI family transcriptional regulator, galactose operon repressor